MITTFVEAFLEAKDLASAIEFVKISYSEGYPLNVRRGQMISFKIGKKQNKRRFELSDQMVRQKTVWDKDQIRSFMMAFFSRLEGTMYIVDKFAIERRQANLIIGVAEKFAEMKRTVMEGRDVEKAMDELDGILKPQGSNDEIPDSSL